MKHVNFAVKKTKKDKTGGKMIREFRLLSFELFKEVLERSYYRKKSELKQLRIKQKKRRIRQFMKSLPLR